MFYFSGWVKTKPPSLREKYRHKYTCVTQSGSAYSRLEHLAQSIGRYAADDLYGMFTGYFDDAGGADHGYTVVAGWVSTLEKWRTLAEQWSLMLERFNVPYFDMKTLSHFKGVYAPWKNDPKTKDAFQGEACRIIASNALFQFASLVDHNAFANVNRIYKLKEYVGNEYALAGLTCADRLRKWVYRQPQPQPFEIVFDDGTAKRGKLVQAMKRESFAEPIFRSPLPKNGLPGVTQLQAADFLAYEVRKVRADDPHETRPIEKHRISLRKLIWVDSEWGSYTEDDLLETCEKHPQIHKR